MTDDLPRLLTFEKCAICGCVEKWNAEAQRYENPVHDYAAHGIVRPESRRMTSEELFSIPNPDFSKCGNQREA